MYSPLCEHVHDFPHEDTLQAGAGRSEEAKDQLCLVVHAATADCAGYAGPAGQHQNEQFSVSHPVEQAHHVNALLFPGMHHRRSLVKGRLDGRGNHGAQLEPFFRGGSVHSTRYFESP